MPPKQGSGKPQFRLHEFLRQQHETILQKWEELDRATLASAERLTSKELRNNLPDILVDLAVQSERTPASGRYINFEQKGPQHHAEHRWKLKFTLEEVTREYALLRVIILQLLSPRVGELPQGELVFLNEGLDQAIDESVSTYVAKANSQLQGEQERLRATLTSITDGVISTDTEGHILFLNPAAERISGWTQAKAIGRPVDEVLVTEDETTRKIRDSLASRAMALGEKQSAGGITLHQRSGERVPIEESVAPMRDTNGNDLGAVVTFRDISEVRLLTEELTYLASHDALTSLPNRVLLHDRLAQELAHAERNGTRLALLYLDLDLFKKVNDVLGHGAGDELLRQVAGRLVHCVRRTDTVSRLGGDEFAILLSDVEQETIPGELARKITKRLSDPFVLHKDTVNVSTSIGISLFPEDGRDAETLIKHADTAMYQAKAWGRGGIQFFTREMNRRAVERHELERSLRAALEEEHLSLYYQPQIAPASGQLIGAEALLRWHHPQKGLISPADFIPVAEESGDLMVSIGNWVMENAYTQARAWLDAGHTPVRISVNISIVQLRDDRFTDFLDELLQRFPLPPDLFQLELTESVLMSDIEGAADRVRRIKEMGVAIAVDDFGTGYSSLSYLKVLPIDELKIDQSFVHNLHSDVDSAAIVQAVIRMAQSLKRRVIAEGVDSKEALDFLVENECGGAQGFYLSEPLPAEVFARQFLAGAMP